MTTCLSLREVKEGKRGSKGVASSDIKKNKKELVFCGLFCGGGTGGFVWRLVCDVYENRQIDEIILFKFRDFNLKVVLKLSQNHAWITTRS